MTLHVQRYALGIEYLGTHFSGWQRQIDPKLRTVQGVLEKSISQIANETITVVCAGRTDAGVHAASQIVHFDTDKVRTDHIWLTGINAHLPRDCSVRFIKAVRPEFHARHKAIARHYRYYIHQTPYRSAVLDPTSAWVHGDLDYEAMQKAADLLIGTHDFSAFRSSECQAKNPVRTLHALNVETTANGIVIYAHANAFLHHMVRNLVGTLLAIGQGKHDVEWAYRALLSRDRAQSGVKAPAHGLFLVQVDYPEGYL